MNYLRLISLATMFLATVCFGQELKVRYAITSESWVPYWIVSEEKVEGIFYDLLLEIKGRTGLPLEAVSGMLPPKRAQMLYEKREIELECCVNPAWRQQKNRRETDLWSETVIEAREVLVFPKGSSFVVEGVADLEGKSVATILGYGYVGEEFFKRNDSLNSYAQMSMVASGRVNAAIIDQNELEYLRTHKPHFNNLMERVELGPVINKSSLKMRVHASDFSLLEKLDDALVSMRNDGSLTRIINSYIQ